MRTWNRFVFLLVAILLVAAPATAQTKFVGPGSGVLTIGQIPSNPQYIALWATNQIVSGYNHILAADSTGVDPNTYLQAPNANGTLFLRVNSVNGFRQFVPPPTNTFVTTGGSPMTTALPTEGSNCAGANLFVTPSIGPAPSAGMSFWCADLADSTPGNVSLIFSTVYNSGSRYSAAVTGIGVALGPNGNAWGGQFQALCGMNAAGATNPNGSICQGVNIEADVGLTGPGQGVNAIAATMVIGPSSAYCLSNSCPASTYFNIVSNGDFVKAASIFQLNDAARGMLLPTGAIMRALSNKINTQDGIDLRNITFSGCAYHSTGFCVDNLGNVSANGLNVAKMAPSGSAPGSSFGKFEVVCGSTAGTAKLVMYAGVSSVPTTVTDNVGSGVAGC